MLGGPWELPAMPALGALRTFVELEPAARTFAALSWALATPIGVSLRLLGFRRLERVIERVPVRRSMSKAGALDVEAAEVLVTRAFARSLGPRGCLPQSIVQCVVHRAMGREVDLVIGVRKQGEVPRTIDFEAHAWVEEKRGPKRDVGHFEIWRSP